MNRNEHEPTIAVDTYLAVPLCYDLGVLEDWLLHASPDTLAELVDFAYHASGNPQLGVTELITDLGRYNVALRRLLRPQHTKY